MTNTFRIPLAHDRFLSGFREGDEPALLKHLATKDVYLTTLNIPHPYTEADAYFWIRKRKESADRQGIDSTFAIRQPDGELIGAVGADEIEARPRHAEVDISYSNWSPNFRSHRAEIGYWLARPFWGQGIMTDAVGAFAKFAFEQFELERLTAHVFAENVASARVLEKNGFRLEGALRQHFLKDGRMLDARIYGLLKYDTHGR
jgi:RimJ/RimL family protein N-acetyltransferase